MATRRTTRTTPTALQEAPADPRSDTTSPAPVAVEPEGTAPAPGPSTRTLLARLPLYQQIAEDLRAQIESGQLAPGQPIPSESILVERYGVSRITARAAVRDLRASGLVITEQGRATRVRDALTVAALDPTVHVSRSPAHPGDTSGAIAPTGRRRRPGPALTRYRTWDTDWSTAEEPSRYRSIAKGTATGPLGLPDAAPVFVTDRLLARDGALVAHTTYVPLQVCADIAELQADPFAAPAALYAAITAAGHQLTWTDTTDARMPTPDEANTLAIPPGVPVLVHHRVTTAEDLGPVLYEQTRLNPQRVTITHPAPMSASTTA